jgi:hypothetical protein
MKYQRRWYVSTSGAARRWATESLSFEPELRLIGGANAPGTVRTCKQSTVSANRYMYGAVPAPAPHMARLYAERLATSSCSAAGLASNSISSNSGSSFSLLLLIAARALVARPGATKSDSGDAYEMFLPTEKSHAWAPHSYARQVEAVATAEGAVAMVGERPRRRR